MSELTAAAINRVETLLCQRYNVRSLDGLNIAAAVAQAREGDVEALIEAMTGREMYRWQADVDEAIAVLREAPEEPEPVTEEVTRPSRTRK